MRFWSKVVLATGLLTVAGALGLRLALQRQVPDRVLKQELEKALGYPVRYRSFQLNWKAQLRLNGVQLLDPEGNPFFTVERAELDFDRSRALEGKLVLLRLLLDEPELTMSQKLWRQLSGKRGRSNGRSFPLRLRGLDVRWLDDDGRLSWQIHDWQGSMPPVPAGHWKVAVQSPDGQVVEAGGQGEELDLKLLRFPAARLAPGFEPDARVDLEAHRRQNAWLVEGKLCSRAYTGPLQLELDAQGRGILSTAGGQLGPLGAVQQVRVPFAPSATGWRLGPAELSWRGAVWKLSGGVEGGDRFQGSLACAAVPVTLPPGWSAGPAALDLKVQGTIRRQQADFAAQLQLPGLRTKEHALGDWSATAGGPLRPDGLPGVSWQLTSPRGGWPGRLRWNARSGDLAVDFAPLQFARFLPGWRGELRGNLRRQGHAGWELNLSLPQLRGPAARLDRARLRLAEQRWQGQAVFNGVPLGLTGALEAPVVEARIGENGWKVKGLSGRLVARLALEANRRLRLTVARHDLRWQGQSLPQVQGSLVGEGQGWKSDGLSLVAGPLKVPLALRGGWDPHGWELSGKFPALALDRRLSPRLAGIEAQAEGQFVVGWDEIRLSGQLKNLKIGGQGLGDWKLAWRRSPGKPGRLQMSNPALLLPRLGKLKAELDWRADQEARLDLSAPRLNLAGLSLAPVALRLQGSSVGALRLSGRMGAASLSGTVDARKRALRLEGRLQELALAGLPGLPPGSAGTLVGRWTASGSMDSPQVTLSAQVKQLQLLQFKLGDLPLALRHAGGKTRAALGPLAVEECPPVQKRWPKLAGQVELAVDVAGGQNPRLEARLHKASYAGQPLAELRLGGLWKSLELQSARLSWQVEPLLELEGSVGLQPYLRGQLRGHRLQDLCLGLWPVQGQAYGQLELTNQPSFEGELRGFTVAGQNLGTGKVKLEKGRLSGQDFPAEGVAVLQQRYPELKARLGFDFSASGPGYFQLSGGHWQGKAFPDVRLTARPAEDNSWLLSPVEVSLEPALTTSGRLWPESQRLELAGRLDGQSLADLALVAGGAPPPDLFTRLSGNYRLRAQGRQAHLQFEGQTHQMTYRGVALGEGQLHLSADPELKGELLLAQPLEIGSLTQVPTGLQSVLPATRFLSALRLRGVRLGGSLESPSASPLWTAPEIKVTLPGGIPIQF